MFHNHNSWQLKVQPSNQRQNKRSKFHFRCKSSEIKIENNMLLYRRNRRVVNNQLKCLTGKCLSHRIKVFIHFYFCSTGTSLCAHQKATIFMRLSICHWDIYTMANKIAKFKFIFIVNEQIYSLVKCCIRVANDYKISCHKWNRAASVYLRSQMCIVRVFWHLVFPLSVVHVSRFEIEHTRQCQITFMRYSFVFFLLPSLFFLSSLLLFTPFKLKVIILFLLFVYHLFCDTITFHFFSPILLNVRIRL